MFKNTKILFNNKKELLNLIEYQLIRNNLEICVSRHSKMIIITFGCFECFIRFANYNIFGFEVQKHSF